MQWSNLPTDILQIIFSFLPPNSLARASSSCKQWHSCATTDASPCRLPCFVAFPLRNTAMPQIAFLHDNLKWRSQSLDFLPEPMSLLSAIGSLLLCKAPHPSSHLRLALCNPFTRRFRYLPQLEISRVSPAIGVASHNIYVAGGMSDGGVGAYEPTVEVYDSVLNKWRLAGTMPAEFAVRLTVWTSSEGIFHDGVLYWITSAKAYKVMAMDLNVSGDNAWSQMTVPMADDLGFAALVVCRGKLMLVGGTCGGEGFVWELQTKGKRWELVERIPVELGRRYLRDTNPGTCEKHCWGNYTKCAGGNDVVCLHRELGSGLMVWREATGGNGVWEWSLVDGYCAVKQVQRNCLIRGVLLRPDLNYSNPPFLIN